MGGASTESAGVQQVLSEACARNAAGELHYVDGEGQFRTARLRFLALEERVVCIDQPQNIDVGVDLRPGQHVNVYLQLENNRWSFETRVDKCFRLVRLNRQHRVPGMTLVRPDVVRNEQRRRDFRVSVVSHKIECLIVPECGEHPHACDLESPRATGMIQNVSARGLCVVAYCPPGYRPVRGGRVFIRFSLPAVDDEFNVLASICHLRSVSARESVVLGLRIQPLPCTDETTFVQRLSDFVMAQQRRMLRRRK